MMKSRYRFIALLFFLFAVGVFKDANTIPISGSGSAAGSFTGSVSISGTTLTVQLTNTSTVFLTGFMMNLPTNVSLNGSFTSSDPDFQLLNSVDNVNGQPFGQFDFGAALGGNLEEGHNPRLGLGPNITGTFTFGLTSASTPAAFLEAQSSKGEKFAVRFRALPEGGSYDVPGRPGNGSVPEPGTLVLLGSGLIFLAAYTKRNYQKILKFSKLRFFSRGPDQA